MKTRKVKVKRLGVIEFDYPQSDKDINNQVEEIFRQEHYKLGRVKNGVYLDVGANVGLATTYFQDIAKQIYALEPNPQFYEALFKNTEKFKNVKTFNMGISYTNHKDTMFSISSNPEDIPSTFFPPEEAKQQVDVTCVGLNQFLTDNNIKHVNTLKIDVEGSEYAIFPSDDFKAASKKIDRIVGEAHYNPTGCFPEIIPVMLGEYGYKTKFLKLKKPNMNREIGFNGDGTKKVFRFESSTIFYAEK